MSRRARRQILFVVVFLIVVLFFVTTFRMGVVHGRSMEPTYQDGQVLLVRRRNWFSGPLKHNDIILLRKDRDVLVKRIYRLEGEEIDKSYPNVLLYTRANALTDYYEQVTEQTPKGPQVHLHVPKDHVVVLGDNLPESEDSRAFGPIPLSDVLGVVVNSPPPPYNSEMGAKGPPIPP